MLAVLEPALELLRAAKPARLPSPMPEETGACSSARSC